MSDNKVCEDCQHPCESPDEYWHEVEDCANQKIIALRKLLDVYHGERQELRGVLRVSLPAASGTVVAEFDPQPSLVDAAKVVVAERDALRALCGEILSYEEKAEMMPADLVQRIREAAKHEVSDKQARAFLRTFDGLKRTDCPKCGGKNTYFVAEKMCSTCDTGNA